jgi:DNA-binding NarL/FixJ family response regulator
VPVNFRVVIADDDADMRALLGAALRRDGRFTVVGEAADGDEAVEVTQETQPDLVLLDLGMPGRGGLEALPLLRDAAPDAQIIVVSGFPGDRLEAQSRAVGAVGYVEKRLSPKRTVLDVLAVAGVLEAIGGSLANRARVDRDLASSRAARRFMEETLAQWDCRELLDSVKLLVSELVTNAVVHADSEAEVAVILSGSALRVEVADNGSGTIEPREAADFDTSGRGMALVETMSSRWGTEPRPGGGRVTWFEIERTGFEPAS